MALPDICRIPGCGRQRTRFSVHCEEHHREELARLETHSEPNNNLARQFRGTIYRCDDGILTEIETTRSLLDQFTRALQKNSTDLQAALRLIPRGWVWNVRRYLVRTAEPHLHYLASDPLVANGQASRLWNRLSIELTMVLREPPRDFFFRGEAAGCFTGLTYPICDGIYAYDSYRGPSHYEMVVALKEAGQAACCYYTEDHRVNFTVVKQPAGDTLQLRNITSEAI